MIYAVAIGVFVFVTLAVAGCRALDLIAAEKAKREAAAQRLAEATGRTTDYRGPAFTRRGREAS